MTWMRMSYLQNVVMTRTDYNSTEAESTYLEPVMSDELPHYRHTLPHNTHALTQKERFITRTSHTGLVRNYTIP